MARARLTIFFDDGDEAVRPIAPTEVVEYLVAIGYEPVAVTVEHTLHDYSVYDITLNGEPTVRTCILEVHYA